MQLQEIQNLMELASGEDVSYSVKIPEALAIKIKEQPNHRSLVAAVLMDHFMESANGSNGASDSPAQRILDLKSKREDADIKAVYHSKTIVNIAALREEKGWTQEELAKKAKIGASSLHNMEHGKDRNMNFSRRLVVSVAKALGCDVSDIVK